MSTNRPTVRILLADDHVLFRDGVRHILEAEPTFEVVGEAADSDGAVAMATAKKPDVLLLDVEMDGVDTATTVRRIRDAAPRCKIIILTMHDDAGLLNQLLWLGVRGYLLKSVSWRELVSTVHSVATSPNRVVLSVSPRTVTQTASPRPPLLSPREREVLELTAQAMSNGQIATRLSLTEATIKRHLRNIFAKLGAVSRIDAVNKARTAALISPRPGVAESVSGPNDATAGRSQ